MAGKRVLSRLGGFLALLVVCFALFDVPSAYAVASGKPHWFAWAVGVLAFPVLPLVWTVLGERKRTVDPKKPAKTSRSERIAMRIIVVAVIVIGGLFVAGRGKVFTAVRHHALWFIPTTPSHVVPDSPLLQHVPNSAHLVLWLRDTDTARETFESLSKPLSAGSFELIIALDDDHTMFAERGDIDLVEKVTALGEGTWWKWIGWSPSTMKTLPDGTRIWSTKEWPAGSGPPAALLDQMRAAPDDAFVIAAGKDIEEISSGVGWIGGRDGELEFAGELVLRDDAAATKLYDKEQREISEHAGEMACWKSSGGTIDLTREGHTLHGRAAIQLTDLHPLLACEDKD